MQLFSVLALLLIGLLSSTAAHAKNDYEISVDIYFRLARLLCAMGFAIVCCETW